MNQTLKCVDCKNDFIFTDGEQEFYASKSFKPPRRCKECRQLKKTQSTNDQRIDPAPAPRWTNGSDSEPQGRRSRRNYNRDDE